MGYRSGRISCFLSLSYIAHGNHSRNKALERGEGGEDLMNGGEGGGGSHEQGGGGEDRMNGGEGGRIA